MAMKINFKKCHLMSFLTTTLIVLVFGNSLRSHDRTYTDPVLKPRFLVLMVLLRGLKIYFCLVDLGPVI